MAEESGIFTMSLVNSDLYTITYTPDPNGDHRYCGSGLNQLGQHLQFLSPSALVEPIQEGVWCTNDDSNYWESDVSLIDFSFLTQYGDFDIVFNKTNIIPTGTIQFNYRSYVPGGNNPEFRGLTQLWAKKNHNPALSGDILIAEIDDSFGTPLLGYNEFLNDTREFTINEGGRSTWEALIYSGLAISISGHLFNFAGDYYKISGMELMISGYPAASQGTLLNSNFDMYTYGHSTNSGSLDMHLESNPPSGYLPLYIAGHIANSGSFNMNLTGVVRSSGNFDMYMYGHQSYSKAINLTVKGPTIGSGNSGPDMYMLGPSFIPASSILPMVVYFDTNPRQSVDMFVQNNNVSSTGMLSMYIQAPSGTYGAVPWSGILPLFIARDSESIAGGINLYICGPQTQNSGFPMIIDGTNSLINQFNMIISGGGPINNSINLFCHGF